MRGFSARRETSSGIRVRNQARASLAPNMFGKDLPVAHRRAQPESMTQACGEEILGAARLRSPIIQADRPVIASARRALAAWSAIKLIGHVISCMARQHQQQVWPQLVDRAAHGPSVLRTVARLRPWRDIMHHRLDHIDASVRSRKSSRPVDGRKPQAIAFTIRLNRQLPRAHVRLDLPLAECGNIRAVMVRPADDEGLAPVAQACGISLPDPWVEPAITRRARSCRCARRYPSARGRRRRRARGSCGPSPGAARRR